MPTNKPKIQAVMTNQYYEKLIKIAKNEERSISQMTAKIVENFIDEYERKNGAINIKNVNMIDNKGTINM